MKKSTVRRIMSALLIVAMMSSLLLSGGISVFADDGIFNVTNAEELKAALNQNTEVKQINITESFTVTDDCTIQLDNAHIANYHSTMMNIAMDVTLTLENGGAIGSFWPSYEGDWQTPPLPASHIVNQGTIIVENGGATVADFDVNNGSIIVKAGGEAVCCNQNDGTVIVESGGKYITTQGSKAYNSGQIIIQNGAEMQSRFGSSIVNAKDGTIQLDGKFYCGCIGMDGNDVCWFENYGKVTGNGDVILYEADHSILPVFDMDGLIAKIMTELGQSTRFEIWDDIFIFKLAEVSDFQQLKAVMTADRTVAGEHVEGNMDTLVELTDSFEIPSGENVGAMTRITVPENVKLTINDGALLETGVENHGIVEVKSGGKFATTQGGRIENHGTIIVDGNAEIKSQMGGEIVNCNDGRLTLNGTLYCGCYDVSDAGCLWFENSGRVCGEGKFFIYNPMSDEGSIIPCKEAPIPAAAVINQIGETAELNDEYIQISHFWGPWTQTKAPSCSEQGEATSACEVCGITETKVIPVKEHKPVTIKAVAPTFKATGKTAGQKCSDCGAVITPQKAVAKLASPKLSKVKKAKKGFTAKWAKVNVDGYQIRYSLKKNMKTAKTVNVAKTATSRKVSKLKAKKKYYVQIRGYKMINGKKVYSDWSAKKNVTTKK